MDFDSWYGLAPIVEAGTDGIDLDLWYRPGHMV